MRLKSLLASPARSGPIRTDKPAPRHGVRRWRACCDDAARTFMLASLLLPILMQAAPADAPPQRVLRLDDAVQIALKNQPIIQ